MNTQILDHFRSGLLLLAMLAIAIVAGQAQSRYQESPPAESIFEPALELPASVEFGTDDPDNTPVP